MRVRAYSYIRARNTRMRRQKQAEACMHPCTAAHTHAAKRIPHATVPRTRPAAACSRLRPRHCHSSDLQRSVVKMCGGRVRCSYDVYITQTTQAHHTRTRMRRRMSSPSSFVLHCDGGRERTTRVVDGVRVHATDRIEHAVYQRCTAQQSHAAAMQGTRKGRGATEAVQLRLRARYSTVVRVLRLTIASRRVRVIAPVELRCTARLCLLRRIKRRPQRFATT